MVPLLAEHAATYLLRIAEAPRKQAVNVGLDVNRIVAARDDSDSPLNIPLEQYLMHACIHALMFWHHSGKSTHLVLAKALFSSWVSEQLKMLFSRVHQQLTRYLKFITDHEDHRSCTTRLHVCRCLPSVHHTSTLPV